jgi:GDPmannose 4,6-dehydratase
VVRRYFWPAVVDTLLGDPSMAWAKLGWTAKTSFDALVAVLAREDLREAERDALVTKHGHKVHRQYE